MKSNWYIVARFCIASARKYFSRRNEAVGDQLFMRSLICMSPLTHILALSLSRPPYEFSLALKAHFTGINSSAGKALSDVSDVSNVSLSDRPNISFLIACPNFSLIIGDNLKTCERDLSLHVGKFLLDLLVRLCVHEVCLGSIYVYLCHII